MIARALRQLLLLIAIAGPALAVASEGELRLHRVDSYLRDDVYLLNASADILLPDEPKQALESGVPLVFVVEIELQRTRKWLPNAVQHLVEQRYRLSFHGLSRSYRVENLNTGVRDSFRSLASALWHIGTLHDFPLIDRVLLRESRNYLGAIRYYLDLSELPLPLRPQAYLSSQWRFESEVLTWSIK